MNSLICRICSLIWQIAYQQVKVHQIFCLFIFLGGHPGVGFICSLKMHNKAEQLIGKSINQKQYTHLTMRLEYS